MPRKRSILVVEDEVALQKLVRRQAERRGIEVLEALSGEAALDAAIKRAPGLILLDLHLPGARGVTLLTKLKRDPRTAHIPIVVWSGADAAQGEREALVAGVVAYFEKTDLRAMIERVVELLVLKQA